MSEKKWTPTPWTAPGNGNIVGADGTLVATVPRPKGTGASLKRDANAALLAAAPALYEALEKSLAECGCQIGDTLCSPCVLGRRALAAARGEAK